MKGYVPTPNSLVDKMVDHLFSEEHPTSNDYLLDPGCGDGQFVAGVLRWCRARDIMPPKIVGVELNPSLAAKARKRFQGEANVEIVNADYLGSRLVQHFRFVVGNPPYVSLENITERQRQKYRSRFVAAHGRFDLYMLFFERAIQDMVDDGRLVFVTPEKFVYVESAGPLRKLLAQYHVESIDLAPEDAFCDRTTYPAITALNKYPGGSQTTIRLRNGVNRHVNLPSDGNTWLPFLMGHDASQDGTVPLISYCLRISAGIATGADSVFMRPLGTVNAALRRYAHPALAGRDMSLGNDVVPTPHKALLVPYDQDGVLLPENKLGALGLFLRESGNRQKLEARTCAQTKPWYAFHDNCPLPDIRRPKILCKDIGERPKFWIDRSGVILPLHSLYYIVPHETTDIDALCAWLNRPKAATWLTNHCHRAANGFIRLQSRVIKDLPVPIDLAHEKIKRVA